MAKPSPYVVKVVEVSTLSPHLRRVVFSGDSLARFPEGFLGGYMKFLFDKSPPHAPPRSIPNAGLNLAALLKRSYTIRAFDPATRHLTLDFVCSGEKGPATNWANHVEVGEELVVAGPGPVRSPDPSSDWVLLCGDMTALPGIAVQLEALPESMRGYAVIHVLSDADKLDLRLPKGVEVQWVVDEAPSSPQLVDAVRNKAWLPGRVGVWSASEFSIMRSLREYFRGERLVPSSDIYISSYWKQGDTDEEHKLAKRRDESGAGIG